MSMAPIKVFSPIFGEIFTQRTSQQGLLRLRILPERIGTLPPANIKRVPSYALVTPPPSGPLTRAVTSFYVARRILPTGLLPIDDLSIRVTDGTVKSALHGIKIHPYSSQLFCLDRVPTRINFQLIPSSPSRLPPLLHAFFLWLLRRVTASYSSRI